MKKIIEKVFIWLMLFSFIIEATPVYAITKEETIYAKLNSNGKVTSSAVYEHLYGSDSDVFNDRSSLKNINNVNGDEKYTKEDNNLTWEAKGNDIYYSGESEKELPIELEIKYYLNKKEYQAKEMLGKKGNVKIVINYKNNLQHQVIVNNNIETLYTPFVIATTSLLSNDTNKNIKISSGKVINNGTTSLIVGISSPGLYESLDVEELKGLGSLEITYYTESFELSSIYSVATSKLIGEEDLDIINNVKSLYNGITLLQDNMNLLVDGSRQLADGTNEFNNAIKDLGDKYHYYRNISKEDLIKALNPILNNAIENTLPQLKDKLQKTIDEALNNIQPEMLEAIASATANSTKEVIEGEITRIVSEIHFENYISNIIGEDLINELSNDQEIQALTSNLISSLSNMISNEIDIVTEDALNGLVNNIRVNMSYEEKQAYIENIANQYNISYENAEAIVDKVQLDTINGVKNNISSNTRQISLNIASAVINNITNEDHLNTIVNEYIANINDIIQEIMNNEKIEEYKEQLKDNIANYIKEELSKKDLIERYTDTSEYINSITEEIIDKTAERLSEEYFTDMTSDAIKELINNELNKYSIKDELDNIINNINSKIEIVDEKVDLLTSSVSLINSGANQLADGLYRYNNEGISQISNFVNGDVRSLTDKVDALMKLSEDYKTLDDINETYNGSSKIIFMIDSLKKEEDKKITTEKIIEKETLWDKIKGLFK